MVREYTRTSVTKKNKLSSNVNWIEVTLALNSCPWQQIGNKNALCYDQAVSTGKLIYE